MATNQQNLGVINSEATWKPYIEFISAALDAALPRTADTGQLNLGSYSRPVGANTVVGYEIREWDDGLKGSHPLVMKIEYGTGSNVNYVQLWITVGKGSNGSGTITDVIIPRTARDVGGVFIADSVSLFSSTTGICSIALAAYIQTGQATTNQTAFLYFERTADENGDPTGVGVRVGYVSTAAVRMWTGDYATQTYTEEQIGPVAMPHNQTSSLNANMEAVVYPVVNFGTGKTLFPIRSFACVYVTDTPQLTPVDAILAGKEQVMMRIPRFVSTLYFMRANLASNTAAGILMRWE